MVYRPAKKKSPDAPTDPRFPGNRPSSDPLEGPLQGATHAPDVLEGDDRNLVAVDSAFAEADFEDRAWLFWQKYRGAVYGLVVVVLLGGAGWGAWHFWQKQQLADMQAAFAQLSGAQAYLDFGQAHAGTPLGRVGLIRGADELYAAKQYKEAAAAYATAAKAWAGEPVAQRAKLGQAMATLMGGDATEARLQLETLANDSTVSDSYRAEAGYYVASLALQSGDSTGARTWIDQVQALPEAGAWGRQATDLAQLAPALGLIAPGAVPASKQQTISAPGLSPYVPANAPTAPGASSMLGPQPTAQPSGPMAFPQTGPGAAAGNPAPATPQK
jgi:hypothetical protein